MIQKLVRVERQCKLCPRKIKAKGQSFKLAYRMAQGIMIKDMWSEFDDGVVICHKCQGTEVQSTLSKRH